MDILVLKLTLKTLKNIAILLTNDIQYDRRMQRIIGALSNLYNITVISRNVHGQTIENDLFNVIYIKPWFNNGFLFYLEYNLRLWMKLFFLKVDIYYAVDYDTIMPAVIMGTIKNKNVVLDAHELFEESIEIVHRSFVKKIWTWIGKVFIPKIDLGITVSKSIAIYYQSNYSKEFNVIRNIPDFFAEEKPYQINKSEPKIILYQGVLNVGRKLEILIDSALFLGSPYEIWIIGEGDIAQELRNRAYNIKSECKIVFHSWVAPENLKNYTSKAYLGYNLLDETSGSYYYSLANKFFDYLHAGVPSLNSNFPEYLEMNDKYDCCFLMDNLTGKELAEFILDLDEKVFLQKKMNCGIASTELNWQNEEKILIKLIESIA